MEKSEEWITYIWVQCFSFSACIRSGDHSVVLAQIMQWVLYNDLTLYWTYTGPSTVSLLKIHCHSGSKIKYQIYDCVAMHVVVHNDMLFTYLQAYYIRQAWEYVSWPYYIRENICCSSCICNSYAIWFMGIVPFMWYNGISRALPLEYHYMIIPQSGYNPYTLETIVQLTCTMMLQQTLGSVVYVATQLSAYRNTCARQLVLLLIKECRCWRVY